MLHNLVESVYVLVCLLSMLSSNVHVLALNKVVVAAELAYKSCSSLTLKILSMN